jgi:polysaccharide export outer membrane protein
MTIEIRSVAAIAVVACCTATAAVAQTTRPPNARVDPAPAVAPNLEVEQYKIGPEDTLEISIWKNPDLSRTVVVRPDGKISLPLVNDLQASGLTPLQLRDVLTKGYAAFQPEPEVAVIVREIHSIKVSVVGGVKTPGRYELKSQATVLEALALAGGFTDFAKRDQIFVLRRGPRTQSKVPFNYNRAASLTGEEENFFLQPGDIIVVPN